MATKRNELSQKLTLLFSLAAVAFGLTSCGSPTQYPDLPKVPASASFAKKTLIVQKWAEASCFYNISGVADLVGLDPSHATYGQMADALASWFETNERDLADPAAVPYHVAVESGCFKGLDRWNGK